MRLNKKFKIREIAGTPIIVNQGVAGGQETDLTHIISLNESATDLWHHFSGVDFSTEDAANYLVYTYGISFEQAIQDATKWVDKLTGCGLLEEES